MTYPATGVLPLNLTRAPVQVPSPALQSRVNKKLGLKGGCCAMCAPFSDIEAVIHTDQGSYMNPLMDAVKVHHILATPGPVTLGSLESTELTLVNQAEENGLGDFLCTELMIASTNLTYPALIQVKNQANDRIFSNAPVLSNLCMSNAQLRKKLPCCFMMQATNFAQIKIQNVAGGSSSFYVVARGLKFLPYAQPDLREQLLAYWNSYRSTPFFLTIDKITESGSNVTSYRGGVKIQAGYTATVYMTVPGGGDFELKEPRCRVANGAGTVDASDILVEVKEGVGRSLMDAPIPLGDFVAQPTIDSSQGLLAGEYPAAAGGHDSPPRQLFKRNSRIKITLTNTAAAEANVWLAFSGCMHYYEECPPASGLHRALTLEPMVGPMLVEAPRCPPIQSFAPVQPQQGWAPPPPMPPMGAPGMYGMGMGRLQPGVEYPDMGRPRGGTWGG